MLLLHVSLHSVYDCGGPLDDKWLQPVLLVQVCVHELLESLLSDLVILTLLIELNLLSVYVNNCVRELLLGQDSVLSATNWCGIARITRRATTD